MEPKPKKLPEWMTAVALILFFAVLPLRIDFYLLGALLIFWGLLELTLVALNAWVRHQKRRLVGLQAEKERLEKILADQRAGIPSHPDDIRQIRNRYILVARLGWWVPSWFLRAFQAVFGHNLGTKQPFRWLMFEEDEKR